MSYDLYFYKTKKNKTTEKQIASYLNTKGEKDGQNSWFFENKDAETYFFVSKSEVVEKEDGFFEGFEKTGFYFSLNYARPNFFGRFAFDFVETFLNDLDLYVIDPQAATEKPIKRTKNAFFDTWFKANENTRNYFLKENSDDLYFYLPQSDAFYEYNLNKKVLETKLRRAYCVPKWYVFRRKTDGQVITLAAWVEHLPTVFPPADYFLLIKKQRKNGIGLISAETFSLRFGHFLTNFETTNCKIIHPAQAKAAKMIFETTVFEHDLEEFAERVPIEKCF